MTSRRRARLASHSSGSIPRTILPVTCHAEKGEGRKSGRSAFRDSPGVSTPAQVPAEKPSYRKTPPEGRPNGNRWRHKRAAGPNYGCPSKQTQMAGPNRCRSSKRTRVQQTQPRGGTTMTAQASNPQPENDVFVRFESRVQSYARSFPALFQRARGTELWDVRGRRFLDFLAGAGSLNYGHNNPVLREALVEYIESDGISHSLDLHTLAKERFLESMRDIVLLPRGLDHVVQFTGPTGANAVEAALKLARKVTGRTNVLFFTNGFHGVSQGALAVTGNEHFRRAAGIPLSGSTSMPYDGYLGDDVDTIAYLDRMLADRSSGLDMPAAVILEVVQGEGGLNTARASWLRRLQTLCRERKIVLIVDEIQSGCGR